MTIPPKSSTAPTFSVKNVLFAVIPLAVVVLLVFAWQYSQAQREQPPPVDFLGSLKSALLHPTKLADGLMDADGDLVADAPPEAEWLDPATLAFEVLGSDLAHEQEQWADFVVHLQTITGKPIELKIRGEAQGVRPEEAVPPALQQARDLRAGKIHLVALNTGAVTLSVNEGGAVPFCVMADESGHFGYEMEIIVPAASSVKEVPQLKGSQKVLFASLFSHSGFKAPVTILWKEFNLQPERDYTPVFVMGQEQAIKDIAAGKGDAAPVASDFLKRIVERGEIKADSIRSIHRSKSFPPACFAHAHQLRPDLAEKIKTAFLDFNWQDTSLEKAYAAAEQTKFVPVSYQKDWASVREVEEHIDSLLK